MRVLLSMLSAPSVVTGVQRHALLAVKALLKSPTVEHVHVLAGEWQRYVLDELSPDERVSIEFVTAKNTLSARNLWHLMRLPQLAREHRADIVHLSYPVPIRRSAFHVPLVLSLHDCYPEDIPENFGRWKARVQRIVLRHCLSSVDAIACVSESTRARLAQLASHQACTIPNVVELTFQERVFLPVEGMSDQFLLCVAQHRRNKNLPTVLRAFHRLVSQSQIPTGAQLVIVGAEGPETPALRQFVRANGIAERVHFFSGLSNGELLWCYRNARMLLAPSQLEGFGLPVAEALLAGCPVVCSDLPVFREIGANHCRYVEQGPSFEDSFGDAIREQWRQPRPLPVDLPQYSLATISAAYVRLYESLLSPKEQVTPRPVRANITPEWKI